MRSEEGESDLIVSQSRKRKKKTRFVRTESARSRKAGGLCLRSSAERLSTEEAECSIVVLIFKEQKIRVVIVEKKLFRTSERKESNGVS